MKDSKLHKHGGKSSEAHIDPHHVLKSIQLKEGDKFLDAGCGDGFISLVASRMVKSDGHIYAVDSYQESLDILAGKVQEEKIDNIDVIKADLTGKIPIGDDLIDLCLMANVFHGFVFNNEVDQVMSEIRRLLKPDGRLALVEFEKIENTPGPSFDHRVDLQEVKNAMQGQGLSFVKESKVGPYHYAAVFKLD